MAGRTAAPQPRLDGPGGLFGVVGPTDRPASEPRAEHSLTALRDEQRSKALTAADVPEELLAKAYCAQIAFEAERCKKRWAAQTANIARLGGPEDVRWAAWWQGEASARHRDETVRALERAKHCLVCPTHGISGSEFEVPEGVTYEALSLRGMLTGEGAMAWCRMCEVCVAPGLKALGESLLAAHLDMRPPARRAG